ncbi:hypothetical protein ACLOJK_027102 [Asimina triloba]
MKGGHRMPSDADLKALLDGMAVVIRVGRSLKGRAAPGSHCRQHPPSISLLPVGSKWRVAGDGSSMAARVADLGKMEHRNWCSGSVPTTCWVARNFRHYLDLGFPTLTM